MQIAASRSNSVQHGIPYFLPTVLNGWVRKIEPLYQAWMVYWYLAAGRYCLHTVVVHICVVVQTRYQVPVIYSAYRVQYGYRYYL